MGQSYKLIGTPCACRGPYTFYKAFKYTKNNITNILTINEFFFVKLWNDSDLISIGELRLLWEDKSCDRTLASLRLYILPENTPDGRISDVHGEDEVLAITEKVVIKLEDLLTWITEATDWSWGLPVAWRHESCQNNNDDRISETNQHVNGESNYSGEKDNDLFDNGRTNTLVDCSALDYSDVNREKRQLNVTNWEIRTGVVVLSYSRYCRYRGLLKRLEGVHNEWLRNKLLAALGGFTTTCRTTKILFCKGTFDYPELEGHELLCNHLAPKLRSRIPKKKKQLYPTPDVSETDSSSNCASEDDEHLSSTSSSVSTTSHNSYITSRSSSTTCVVRKPYPQQILPLNDSIQITAVDEQKKMKAFTQNLYAFMRARLTPIVRLPCINDKEINLFEFYNKVKRLGGYTAVTNNKLWKYVLEQMAGENSSTNTTALIRQHYEKFLLPYEQHMAQQFKHISNSQLLMKQQQQQSSSSPKNNLSSNECAARLQAERRKQIMSSTKTVQAVANKLVVISKPGDKENIPLSEKKTAARSASEVIDLCEPEEESSLRGVSIQKASSSAIPEIIDLCGESPIRRSVPSIAATLFPKKRKLDILREGGLEVTPISTSSFSSSEPDVVTITKTTTSRNDGSYSMYEEDSVEILDPKRYSSANGCFDNNSSSIRNDRSKSTQLLDLRTMKTSSDLEEQNLLKKISPSLGPNIEISLVPSEEIKRDFKKNKSVQLPIPALRKISTGELTVKNLSMNETNDFKSITTTLSMSKKTDATSGVVKPQISVTASEDMIEPSSSPPPSSGLSSYMSNVNQSLYIAALYNSVFPTSVTPDFIDVSSEAYQKQLSFFLQQQERQKQQEQEGSLARKFSSILKNNTVTIIENYENVLPD